MAFWTRFIKRKSPLLEAQEKPVGFLKRIVAFIVRQKPFWYASGVSLLALGAAAYYTIKIRPYLGRRAGIVIEQPAAQEAPPVPQVSKEAEPFPTIVESVTEARAQAVELMKAAEAHYQQGALDEAKDELQRAIGLTSDTGLLTVAYTNLAHILGGEGRYSQAVLFLQRALSFDKHFIQGYHNLGVAHLRAHDYDDAQIAFQICLREKPDFAPCHTGLGELHAVMGRQAQAISEFTESLKNQENPDVRYDLGLAYLQSENKALAIEQFTAVQKAAVDPYLRYLALFNRGYALDLLDRHEEAAEDYRAAAALAPKDVDATFNMGLALMAAGRKDEALAAFHRVIDLDPSNFDAYANAATLHAALGQYQEGISLLKPVQDKLPLHKQVNYLLGNLYHRVGKLAESHDAYYRVLNYSPEELSSQLQADAMAALASVFDDSGDLDAAERLYHDAISIDKKAAYLHFNLARTFRRHRKFEDAVKEIAMAVEMTQSSDYQYVLAMAEILLDAELMNKAFDAYRLALEISPNEVYPRFMMAHVAARQQQWTTALTEYNRLLTQNPAPDVRSAVHKGIGNVYHEQSQYDQALSAYKEALTDMPNDAALYYNIARTYMQMDKLDECHMALDKSISLNSESSEAFTLLGVYNFRKGLMGKAYEAFDRAVKLNPENIEAYYNREALRKYQ